MGLEACFGRGTPIRTPHGWRAIEEVAAGDWVLSRDEWDPYGLAVPKRVEAVFARLGRVWELVAGGRVIATTGEHPFFAERGGWAAVRELRPGDRLLCEDGSWLAVEGVRDLIRVASRTRLPMTGRHGGLGKHGLRVDELVGELLGFDSTLLRRQLFGVQLFEHSHLPTGVLVADEFVQKKADRLRLTFDHVGI